MKKLLLLISVLLLAISSVSALQISNPSLGSSNALPGENVQTTLSLTNDGSEIITDIQITSSVASKYNIEFEDIPEALAPGSSSTITIKGKIPTDFEPGKRSIGTITVTSTVALINNTSNSSGNAFTSHNFTAPSNQTPQQIVLPVGMSATEDNGQNTPDIGMDIIGQWHTGTQDGISDIEVMQPLQGEVDAGWARIHSNEINNYWINPVDVDCGGQAQNPPGSWLYGGKIHSGPGLCDGNIELLSADSGWTALYTKPEADGQLILVIAENNCGGGIQQVPTNGAILGKVSTGPGVCDGIPEAFAYTGDSLDAGSVYVVYLPIDHTPTNSLPIGEFESLSWTNLSGWAFDTDVPVTNVHVLVDDVFWKEFAADEERQDLVDANLTSDANHGFSYVFTQEDLTELDTSVNHTFKVIALNAGGNNPELNNSPKVLTAIPVTQTNDNQSNTTNSSNDNSNNNSNNTPTTGTTATATLKMEAGSDNHLIIDRVKINCDKLETVNDGSTIDDVSPGETCYLTIRVKNTFTNNTEIEDIDIEVDPHDRDISSDDASISSLDAGDREEKTLELEIEDDADDGKIKIDITVDGEDEFGKQHSDTWQFSIDIERSKHDLPITKIVVNPTLAKPCQNSRVDVTVYVENNGKRSEDKMAIELSVPAFNFVEKIRDLSIGKNDEERVTFSVPITSSTPIGSFKANARTFFDTLGLSDSRTADIVITKCPTFDFDDEDNPVTAEDLINQVVVPPQAPGDELIMIPSANSENSSTLLDGVWLTTILVLANLVALSVLGVMGHAIFKKKKTPMKEQHAESEDESFEMKDYY